MYSSFPARSRIPFRPYSSLVRSSLLPPRRFQLMERRVEARRRSTSLGARQQRNVTTALRFHSSARSRHHVPGALRPLRPLSASRAAALPDPGHVGADRPRRASGASLRRLVESGGQWGRDELERTNHRPGVGLAHGLLLAESGVLRCRILGR